jgi:cyclic pyranopterin phosphate synthase
MHAANPNTTPSSTPRVPLIDRFGRVHRSLRLSVTDRCNLRCFYCMPEVGAEFAARETLLTFEEITRLVRLLAEHCGIVDLRLTGGEPLVRKDLPKLVAMLAGIEAIADLSLTSNGILLPQFAKPLRQAGLQRINISLDTLDEATYQKISRRSGVDQVIRGIDAAIEAGFDVIKLNTTAVKGVTESQIASLVRFAVARGVQLRFIEFMPLDSDQAWRNESVLSGGQIRRIIEAEFGPLRPIDPPTPSQPASDFLLPGGGRIGLIQSVTQPFCQACDRIRLTADGSIRNCLFARGEFPIRDRIRQGAGDEELIEHFRQAVEAKAAGHGINDPAFAPPERPMYSIGG